MCFYNIDPIWFESFSFLKKKKIKKKKKRKKKEKKKLMKIIPQSMTMIFPLYLIIAPVLPLLFLFPGIRASSLFKTSKKKLEEYEWN